MHTDKKMRARIPSSSVSICAPSVAKKSIWRFALVLSAATLAGCAVGPNYAPPRLNLPEAFSSAQSVAPTTQPARAVDLARWWESMADPQLNSLVHRAIQSNFDLQIAATRLQEARSTEAAVTGG